MPAEEPGLCPRLPGPPGASHPGTGWLGITQCTEGDGNQRPRLLIKKKLGCGGGRMGRTTLPTDEKNTLKSNRLGKTHFQVPNGIVQSTDNVRCSEPLQSVIENKIDIKCIQAHL